MYLVLSRTVYNNLDSKIYKVNNQMLHEQIDNICYTKLKFIDVQSHVIAEMLSLITKQNITNE